MTKMQFGSYSFENNPRRIEVVYSGTIAAYVMPGCGSLTQNLGARCRTVRVEGEVFAATADAAILKLAVIRTACSLTSASLLKLPSGDEFPAISSRFSYTAQGDGRIMSYAIEFIEADSSGGTSGT